MSPRFGTINYANLIQYGWYYKRTYTGSNVVIFPIFLIDIIYYTHLSHESVVSVR